MLFTVRSNCIERDFCEKLRWPRQVEVPVIYHYAMSDDDVPTDARPPRDMPGFLKADLRHNSEGTCAAIQAPYFRELRHFFCPFLYAPLRKINNNDESSYF